MLAFFSPPVIFRICGSGCLKSFSGVWIHRYSVSARTIHIISAETASVKAFYAVFTGILCTFFMHIFKENILRFCIFLRVVADKIWHRLFIIHDQNFFTHIHHLHFPLQTLHSTTSVYFHCFYIYCIIRLKSMKTWLALLDFFF